MPFLNRRGNEFTRCAQTLEGAEVVLMQLLSAGVRIVAIRCNGTEVPRLESDQLVHRAALRCAAELVRLSLALSTEEMRTRFQLRA